MRLPFGLKPASAVIRPATMADAAALAGLHAASFAHPWSVVTFESMLSERAIHAHVAEGRGVTGFIVSRLVLDEAEILSVAVESRARGIGIGRRLVAANLDSLVLARVRQVFLEVDAANRPAIAVYDRLGFVEIGCRAGYYRAADGSRHDALTMRLDLGRRPFPARVLDV